MRNRTVFTLITGFMLICMLALIAPGYAGAEMSASQIIDKTDQLLRGKTAQGELAMEIVTPNWKRTITMKYWSHGEDYSFIHILSPAREEGITFLKKDKLLYQYLPSAEMRIKITPSMMLQSWMGSDFTNDDLVKESSMVKDYNQKIIGHETIEGEDCYKIQLDPKPDAPVVWGKLILWVRKSNYIPAREEFFDEKGKKIKYMTYTDIKRANDRLYPMTMTMVPLNKEGHKTVIRYKSIEFNKKLSRRIFTLKNLEKPR